MLGSRSEPVSGGNYFLCCHRKSPREFNPPRRECEHPPFILTDISPFPKQTSSKGPFLACNPPFNLLLGTKNYAKNSYCSLVPQPWWLVASCGFASSSQAQWIWTSCQHSSRHRMVLVSGCFYHH